MERLDSNCQVHGKTIIWVYMHTMQTWDHLHNNYFSIIGLACPISTNARCGLRCGPCSWNQVTSRAQSPSFFICPRGCRAHNTAPGRGGGNHWLRHSHTQTTFRATTITTTTMQRTTGLFWYIRLQVHRAYADVITHHHIVGLRAITHHHIVGLRVLQEHTRLSGRHAVYSFLSTAGTSDYIQDFGQCKIGENRKAFTLQKLAGLVLHVQKLCEGLLWTGGHSYFSGTYIYVQTLSPLLQITHQ